MSQPHFVADYARHFERVQAVLGDEAFKAAVGGEFEAIGKLERALLEQYGLLEGRRYVIDVGCGSGRLAAQLAPLGDVRYLGTDVVPGLLNVARELTQRPDWRFVATTECSIPEEAAVADYVCFFSVFTHLFHQETYRYLGEAMRVLKPGGLVCFTFLEYRIACHWPIFGASMDALSKNVHLDQFISRDAIEAWAAHLGFEIVVVSDGDQPFVDLPAPIRYEDGRVMEGRGNFGQSLAVLRKPPAEDEANIRR